MMIIRQTFLENFASHFIESFKALAFVSICFLIIFNFSIIFSTILNQRPLKQYETKNRNRNRKRNISADIPFKYGIKNHGSTCYANCILQSLFHTSSLTMHVLSNKYAIEHDSNKLVRKFGKLLATKWSNEYETKLSYDFINSTCRLNKQFKLSGQQDAQEYLMWLLNFFKSTDESSSFFNFIQSTFEFQQTSSITCTNGGVSKIFTSKENMLGLVIPSDENLLTIPVSFLFTSQKSIDSYLEKNSKLFRNKYNLSSMPSHLHIKAEIRFRKKISQKSDLLK